MDIPIHGILKNMMEGFIAVDRDFRVTYWNHEAERLIENRRKLSVGALLWEISPFFLGLTTITNLQKAMGAQESVQHENYDPPSMKWHSLRICPSDSGLFVFIQDITDRKRAEQQMNQMAYYDSLTGLPNQRLFKERLNQILMHGDAYNPSAAVMAIDLDRFKFINDLAGCDNGDRLLSAVAERLAMSIRDYDTLCRYEGNKFTVLLRKVNRTDVEKAAERTLEAFQSPFLLNHFEFGVTPSIGISLFPSDGLDGETLIANALAALREAKKKRNSFRFYSTDLSTQSLLFMERKLREATMRQELIVYYQPQVDNRSGQITGVEALLRWNHPEWGMISPDRFIPLAEETGLIIPIGEWVLKTACAQNKKWLDAGLPLKGISVNLSGKQFMDIHLVAKVKRVLEETGMPPEYLSLEITESFAVDMEQTIATLEQLKQLGVHISMDDFGKGFSSLYYLKRFPLDTIKIDRSFVMDCTKNEYDAALVQTIIAMARSLKLKVIAEGVETKEQLDFLRENDCDQSQGYFFSKPVPAAELEQRMASSWQVE